MNATEEYWQARVGELCVERKAQAARIAELEGRVATLREIAEVMTLPCEYETDYGPDKIDCLLCDKHILCAAALEARDE